MADIQRTNGALFMVGSARRDGNAELLSRRAGAGKAATWMHLLDHPLPPFVDQRHDEPPRYATPTGHELTLLEATLATDHLIFVAPLYWYSLPADTKRYLDYWSKWQRLPAFDFRARMAGKSMSVITSVSDDDLSVAEPLIRSLQLTAGYLKMNFRKTLTGRGNQPGDVLKDAEALREAQTFLD